MQRRVPFDYAAAYQALRRNATDTKGPRAHLDEYLARGWISDLVPEGSPSPPYAGGKAGMDKTLEYAWDDHALSVMATRLGRTEDAAMFARRASNYRNVFDRKTGFMRGRTEDGRWITPFDPREPYYNFASKEASGWSNLGSCPTTWRACATCWADARRSRRSWMRFLPRPMRRRGYAAIAPV